MLRSAILAMTAVIGMMNATVIVRIVNYIATLSYVLTVLFKNSNERTILGRSGTCTLIGKFTRY